MGGSSESPILLVEALPPTAPVERQGWRPSWLAAFDATFGVDLFDPNITLEKAARARGGGVNRLARHGTAALLSAAHPGVVYPLSVAEVIALVQAGDASTLTTFNELGCPLN